MTKLFGYSILAALMNGTLGVQIDASSYNLAPYHAPAPVAHFVMMVVIYATTLDITTLLRPTILKMLVKLVKLLKLIIMLIKKLTMLILMMLRLTLLRPTLLTWMELMASTLLRLTTVKLLTLIVKVDLSALALRIVAGMLKLAHLLHLMVPLLRMISVLAMMEEVMIMENLVIFVEITRAALLTPRLPPVDTILIQNMDMFMHLLLSMILIIVRAKTASLSPKLLPMHLIKDIMDILPFMICSVIRP